MGLLCSILSTVSPSDEILFIVPDCPFDSMNALSELISTGFINMQSTYETPLKLDKFKLANDIIAAGILFGMWLDIDSVEFDADDVKYNSSIVSKESADTSTSNRVKGENRFDAYFELQGLTSEAGQLNSLTEIDDWNSLENNDSIVLDSNNQFASFESWSSEISNIVTYKRQCDQTSDSEFANEPPKNVDHYPVKVSQSLAPLKCQDTCCLYRGRKKVKKCGNAAHYSNLPCGDYDQLCSNETRILHQQNEHKPPCTDFHKPFYSSSNTEKDKNAQYVQIKRFKCAYCFCERDREGLTHHLRTVHGVKYQRGFNI